MRFVRTRRILLVLLLATLAAAAGVAEDDLDGLFQDPQGDLNQDVQNDEAQVDHTLTFTEESSLDFSGKLSFSGGLGVGWAQWEDLAGGAGTLIAAPAANATLQTTLDWRPNPAARFYGRLVSVSTPAYSSDAYPYSYLDLSDSEAFADLSFRDLAYLRLGKQRISWGQGRLFTPGNLMADSVDSLSARVSIPTVLEGLSLVTVAQDYFLDPLGYNPGLVAAGAWADAVLGPLALGGGLRYGRREGFSAAGSAKTVAFGTDFLADLVYTDLDGYRTISGLAGFFREWGRFQLYGEYYLGWDGTAFTVQRLGLAGRLKSVARGLDLGLKWHQDFLDGSGDLALGATWSLQKDLRAIFALPLVYGEDGSYYVIENGDPKDRRLVFALLLELGIPF